MRRQIQFSEKINFYMFHYMNFYMIHYMCICIPHKRVCMFQSIQTYNLPHKKNSIRSNIHIYIPLLILQHLPAKAC